MVELYTELLIHINMNQTIDWKPIPLSLKILSIVFVLWMLGTIANLSNLANNGLPLFGNFVYGNIAILVAIFFDFIGPILFLYSLLKRKAWGIKWAYFYIGLFILNNLIATFTVSSELGLAPILIPTIISSIFLIIIHLNKDYLLEK